MPVVTLQLGQCGNQVINAQPPDQENAYQTPSPSQLGCSFFQQLADELQVEGYGSIAVEEFFRPSSTLQGRAGLQQSGSDASTAGSKYIARAVLIDMEPKVVNAAMSTASSSSWWHYPPKGFLCMQSGSGNNWAHGFHGYGPTVHEDALDLVRREVEACDLLSGFILLQSMAGGTGAGLGTYVAQALRDEYMSSPLVNCCVWPYESGEVIVQVGEC
jgi:tubulin delta